MDTTITMQDAQKKLDILNAELNQLLQAIQNCTWKDTLNTEYVCKSVRNLAIAINDRTTCLNNEYDDFTSSVFDAIMNFKNNDFIRPNPLDIRDEILISRLYNTVGAAVASTSDELVKDTVTDEIHIEPKDDSEVLSNALAQQNTQINSIESELRQIKAELAKLRYIVRKKL